MSREERLRLVPVRRKSKISRGAQEKQRERFPDWSLPHIPHPMESPGFGKTASDRDRLPPTILIPENPRSESLPPSTPPRAERSPQHERLLPHGSFRPPQLAGDLPRRNFLGHGFQLADVTPGPLAPSDLSSSHCNALLSDNDTSK
jgi:hypothetical protein